MRKGAGDGAIAAEAARQSAAKTGRPSAATCRRRKPRASSPAPGQASTPAKPPQASRASMHQGASLPARTTTSRSGATPAACQAGACGNHGGATSASQPPLATSCASAGNSRLISPMPLRSTRNSVKFPHGQPPPGNSSSSAGCPLEMHWPGSVASASPRQMSPRASTSARATSLIAIGDSEDMIGTEFSKISGNRSPPRHLAASGPACPERAFTANSAA